MAIADRPITKLLRNIAHELSDDALHPDLLELCNPLDDVDELPIFPEFMPLAADTPYFQIVAGDGIGSSDSGRRDEQVVEIHLVHSILTDSEGSATLMGNEDTSGLLNLREAIEEALVRPGSPYETLTVYDQDPYELIPEVRAVWKTRSVRQDFLTDPNVEAAATYVRTIIELVYIIEKGTVGA